MKEILQFLLNENIELYSSIKDKLESELIQEVEYYRQAAIKVRIDGINNKIAQAEFFIKKLNNDNKDEKRCS